MRQISGNQKLEIDILSFKNFHYLYILIIGFLAEGKAKVTIVLVMVTNSK